MIPKTINVTTIPILSDNYAYLLKFPDGMTAIIDPGEAKPIINELDAHALKLDYILNTHHHFDHVDGNMELKEKYNCEIIGPAQDSSRIPGIDTGVNEEKPLTLGENTLMIIETPGHTMGGICYYIEEEGILFAGDTLFAMGCGRLFEGTPEEMWYSLQKISKLPDDTTIYCGHEYTLANAEFGLQIEPDNDAIKERLIDVQDLRMQKKSTMPTILKREKETNVFLRAGDAKRFAEIRQQKDQS